MRIVAGGGLFFHARTLHGMPDLPPDPDRLRAILAYLEERVVANETVGIYLRLQRDAFLEALARAEAGSGPAPQPSQPSGQSRQAPQRPPTAQQPGVPGPLPAFARTGQATGYVVQQKRTPRGPEAAIIHTADCTMTEGTTHPITAHEARVALSDPNLEACQFCRPDTELGIEG